MKIAILHQPFCTVSPTNPNGSVEIITYEMARHLTRSCDVIIYAKKGHDEKDFEYYRGVQYRRISAYADEKFSYIAWGIERKLLKLLRFRNFRRPLFASELYCLTYALQVARDIRSQKCDIVHIHNFSQFVPIIRALNPKIKIVLHMHCEWLTQLDRAMIESRLRKVDLVIGVSRYITEKIRRCFPELADRCQTLNNGVDVNIFVPKNTIGARKNDDIRHLLYIGRISPEKGVHVLLKAFQEVLNQIPQAQLKLVGPQDVVPIECLAALSNDPKEVDLKRFYSSNYNSHLRNQLSPNAVSHVSFTGSFPQRSLINFYREADVCVVPSVCNEPCGMPILEAMAMGVPIIATRGGGTSELVKEGETGLLVERDDASALAEAILSILSDEELRKSMVKAARKRAVELFSWEKISRDLLVQYENLVSR